MSSTCIHPAKVTVTTHGDCEDDRALADLPENISTDACQVWINEWSVEVRCLDCGVHPTVTASEYHPDSDGGDPEYPYWNGSILTVDWAAPGPRTVRLAL